MNAFAVKRSRDPAAELLDGCVFGAAAFALGGRKVEQRSGTGLNAGANCAKGDFLKENGSYSPNSVWKTLPQHLAEDVAGWDHINNPHHKYRVWPSINQNALHIRARQRTGFPDTLAVTVERSEAAIFVKIDKVGVLQIFPILDNGKCRVTLGRETSRLELPEVSRRILSLAGFY